MIQHSCVRSELDFPQPKVHAFREALNSRIHLASMGVLNALPVSSFRPWAQAYVEQLLCPQDWFSFWRLNCRLASYHALVTSSKGYAQEDKVNVVLSVLLIGAPHFLLGHYVSCGGRSVGA